jgi:acetyl-CoA carboxylase, biotin carboxylase subunit
MAERPFRRILIANRGEIAVRVMRACREMGISPVAIFSEADRAARHVLEADEAICVGPAPSRQSYLCVERILEAARALDAEAIHPGYGFLSENAAFARACDEAGMIFIGPPPEAIEAMGNKVAARRLMKRAGVAVTPGSEGTIAGADEVRRVADEVGYPVLLKAAAGGGGKGMRVVRAEKEIAAALRAVQSEAGASFGDPSVFVERYVDHPRHIEVQVLAGPDGRAMHLGERECSIQRRHQKLVEESPSPAVDAALRERIGAMAVRAAEAVGYRNAGTVELIMDAGRNVYFMEMNTRLQVEHPVTEMATGLDLVRAQIRIAAGLEPEFTQADVVLRGHAVECRIFAEDPAANFMPSPGRLDTYRPPSGPGVREDSGVYEGAVVPMDYDPMIAKLIVWGQSREVALDRMLRALGEYRIAGVKTTIPFHVALLRHPAFRSGDFDTGFIDKHHAELMAALGGGTEDDTADAALAAALITAYEDRLRLSAAGASAAGAWKRAAVDEGLARRLGGGYLRRPAPGRVRTPG